MGIPDADIVQRIRRNHALEHATMHVLSNGGRHATLIGRSDWRGFVIVGDVDTPALVDAVREGLWRLQHNERWLAVHPRCGTNLAAGALAASVIGQMVASRLQSGWLRFLSAGGAVLAGLALAQPLGRAAQEYLTTSADLAGACITGVRREERAGMVVHHVLVGQMG